MEHQLTKRIRTVLSVFIVLLVISGITAFPIEWELNLIKDWPLFRIGIIGSWFNTIYTAIIETNTNYPFLSYGTDWLAFSHLVIAVAFWGPLKNPVKNIWVVQFGMIACAMVIPLALIAGPIRGIPFFWQMIDCSFGIFGFIPLWFCHRWIIKLESLQNEKD